MFRGVGIPYKKKGKPQAIIATIIVISSMSYLLTFTLQPRLSHISNKYAICDNLGCNNCYVLGYISLYIMELATALQNRECMS